MKYTILFLLVASARAMDNVSIASLIELNEIPPISSSGLLQNKKINNFGTINRGDPNCDDLIVHVQKDDDP